VTVHRDNLRINNQQDASSIQILFCHETLHVSGICAHRQDLSAVHVAIGMFHAGYVEPDSPRQRPHNLHETY
jgi:hypothetical protein